MEEFLDSIAIYVLYAQCPVKAVDDSEKFISMIGKFSLSFFIFTVLF